MSPLLSERPDRSLVRRLLERYATAALELPSGIDSGDRRALRHLVEAAEWIDGIYWKQRSDDSWELRQSLRASTEAASRELARLVDLGYGPWDVFDEDKPFWGDARVAPGGSMYPADLTRQELHAFIAAHPDRRAALMSPTTVVRRGRDGLEAVPYADVYCDELAHAAAALREAGRSASHAGFGAFLDARARDLVGGSLSESEAKWIGVGESPIDVAVGPYEVYDDRLMGVKAAYEATVMVRHPMTDRLRSLEGLSSELDRRLPGSVTDSHRRSRVVIGVYDVAFAAGRANMGAKAIAAMLPNDEQVRREAGSRLLLFRNVIAGKFKPILQPIADRVLTREQAALVSEDAFVFHTLLHEMAHALMMSESGAGSANERLLERYSTIEETRADLVGLVFLDLLTDRRFFETGMLPAAAVTFVAGLVRSLRFGAESDYGRAAAMILNGLLADRAVVPDAQGRLAVDVAALYRSAGAMAGRVQRITLTGSYDEAGELIETQSSMPAVVDELLPRLDDLPIDLEFRFDDSLRFG